MDIKFNNMTIDDFLKTWPGIFVLLIIGFYFLRSFYKAKKARETISIQKYRRDIFGGFVSVIVGLTYAIFKLFGKH